MCSACWQVTLPLLEERRNRSAFPSPSGRRWREAPDEGSGGAWGRNPGFCARTLRPHPLPNPSPNGRGAFDRPCPCPRSAETGQHDLAPPGEGGAKRRMRVRAERGVAILDPASAGSARTLSPNPSPIGRGAFDRPCPCPRSAETGQHSLLPPGEGGAKRRMRVRAEQGVAILDPAPVRFARTLSPTPLPSGEGLFDFA